MEGRQDGDGWMDGCCHGDNLSNQQAQALFIVTETICDNIGHVPVD